MRKREGGDSPALPLNSATAGRSSPPPEMEDDVDMSLDLDAGMNAVPARRKSKFQPKLKGKLLPKPEPVPDAGDLPPFPLVKQEDAVGVEKAEAVDFGGEHGGADVMGFLKEEEEEFGVGMGAPMEVDGVGDEEEDEVVREIDVFFNPSPLDSDTQVRNFGFSMHCILLFLAFFMPFVYSPACTWACRSLRRHPGHGHRAAPFEKEFK